MLMNSLTILFRSGMSCFLDMKRSNWSWGALRISQELLLLGIHVHKKTVKRILLENGMIPPKTRVTPPTWTAILKAHKDLWALDFASSAESVGAFGSYSRQ